MYSSNPESDESHCNEYTHFQDELWLPPVQLINQKNSYFLAYLIQCFASCDSIQNSVVDTVPLFAMEAFNAVKVMIIEIVR